MKLQKKWIQIGVALLLGALVLALPRPEGTRFKVSGDPNQTLYRHVESDFKRIPGGEGGENPYILEVLDPGTPKGSVDYLSGMAAEIGAGSVRIDYVDGLPPQAKRFLSVLAVLLVLFILEPLPLEVTALCIGVLLVMVGISDPKEAWAPYMHPVVLFIMCCLIFAITLNKAGLTKRLGFFIVRKAGNSVTRFTFILCIGLGIASTVMHDAAACAVGIITMLPLMRAAGIDPHTRTAKFMMLSLPFACSCGGMGTLIGGGRCMVAAAFLKEFTGIDLTFFEWIKYCMPAALVTVPVAVCVIYLIYRPDPRFKLPDFDEEPEPWTPLQTKACLIIGACLLLWLTKGVHGIDYSITGMAGVASLVLCGVLTWEDIDKNLAWGTALFIFGGGISLGLAMGYSGSAAYFAHLFFPLIQGKGWLILFIGVGVFGALVTNAMANVAAAALILPIVIPMAQMEGVNPAVLALSLGMATSFAMLLVIGCPPNAIAYSYRYFKSSDLTKAGLVATPVLLTILVAVAGTWWKLLGLV